MLGTKFIEENSRKISALNSLVDYSAHQIESDTTHDLYRRSTFRSTIPKSMTDFM